MSTKLTLEIDSNLLERSKVIAQQYGISLSKLIEDYLQHLAKRENKDLRELTPLVKSLYGIAPLPQNFDPEEAYFDFLLEKHSPKNAS